MPVFRRHPVAFAALATAALAAALPTDTLAQTSTSAAPAAEAPQRISITGSLIKRLDRETVAPVQTISREDIRSSGAASVSEILRTFSAVDAGSVQDGAASGFVGGLSAISLRGLGAQSTLTLINGRRVAPVGAVDINFGRGTLVTTNTIPKGAIDRIEILKDGASALYGSDAMAGVINYILRKDYQGLEANASVGANDKGKGKTYTTGATFGFGNIETQRFNIFGGIEYNKRDSVMHSELKDRGNPGAYDRWRNLNNQFSRFTPDSVASNVFSYYNVPPPSDPPGTVVPNVGLAGNSPFAVPAAQQSTPAAPTRSVPGNSAFGRHYLGTAAGCAPENTVVGGGIYDGATQWVSINGPGVSFRPAGLASSGAANADLRPGQCRFNLDNADEAIAEQDSLNASIRGTFQITPLLTAFADLAYSRTKTTEVGVPRVLTTGIFSTSTAQAAVTWPRLNGSFISTPALILPVGHPDNPTSNGQNLTAGARPVQIIYRFTDLPQEDINDLKTTRLSFGVEGSALGWDFDTAFLYSRQDNERTQTNRLSKSRLEASMAAQTYRFNGSNTPEQAKSVARDAVNSGESTITSLDVRGSRPIFKLPGGDAAVALGFEARKEKLSSTPDQGYLDGDYIGLVANGTSGSRSVQATYAELSLPVFKPLELQVAARHEKYSDFGNSTTGKLGFKWDAVKDRLAFRGTAATGFRAPSISQISNSFLVSFHSFQERPIVDPIRCNTSVTPFVSRGNPPNNRDCNVLGQTTTQPNPGNLPTVIAGNPNIKPEESRSFSLGFLFQPADPVEIVVDAFYFRRNQEIRVQRGADIMQRYIDNPTDTAAAAPIIRNPDQTTWLTGVPNSGPILALVRQYGNFEWTKTAGVDMDVNVRFPSTAYGKFTLKLNGTYLRRFDQKVLATTPVERIVGTTLSDLPRLKGSATMSWDIGEWKNFARYNYIEGLNRPTTAGCLSSTASAADAFARANGWCAVGSFKTIDLGVTYNGFKNLTVSGNVLNVFNHYGRSTDAPHTFTFWDNGTADQLGRRFRLSVDYKFF
jgi:iron complex outermembrane recepter protein